MRDPLISVYPIYLPEYAIINRFYPFRACAIVLVPHVRDTCEHRLFFE